MYQNQGIGLATKVFRDGARIADLPRYMGTDHLRHLTAGTSANAEAQIFLCQIILMAFALRTGNLINALKKFLDDKGHRHINTESDSESLMNSLQAYRARRGEKKECKESLMH